MANRNETFRNPLNSVFSARTTTERRGLKVTHIHVDLSRENPDASPPAQSDIDRLLGEIRSTVARSSPQSLFLRKRMK